jgi:hypothetical protein
MSGLDDGWNDPILIAHPRQDRHPVEIGHDQIENQQIDRNRTRGRLEPLESLLATFSGFRPVTKAPDQGFKQPALNGVIINDEYGAGHATSWRERICALSSSHRA